MSIRTISFAVALLTGLLLAGNAHALLETYEDSVEASTLDVSIPTSTTAGIVVRKCEECPSFTVRLTNASRFYVGKRRVELREFREIANSGTRGLVVLYFPESLEVTRLVVSPNAD